MASPLVFRIFSRRHPKFGSLEGQKLVDDPELQCRLLKRHHNILGPPLTFVKKSTEKSTIPFSSLPAAPKFAHGGGRGVMGTPSSYRSAFETVRGGRVFQRPPRRRGRGCLRPHRSCGPVPRRQKPQWHRLRSRWAGRPGKGSGRRVRNPCKSSGRPVLCSARRCDRRLRPR